MDQVIRPPLPRPQGQEQGIAGAGMRRQEGPAVFLRHSFRAAGAVPGGDGLAAGRRQEGDVLLPGGAQGEFHGRTPFRKEG